MTVQAGRYLQLASGITLHYASCGEKGKPLVVFLHGFPEAWFAWEAMLPLGAAHCFCVAPDLRGFNLSDKPAQVSDYRIDKLIGDMENLVHGLGYEQAIFVAHDWGGAVAFSTAIAKPALVRRLMVLNAPHPIPFARGLKSDPAQQAASAYMNALRAPGSEAELLADDCAALLAKFAGANDRWLTPTVAQRYRDAWRQPGAMTGSVNYYRASPLYPPTGDDRGAAAITLVPGDFRVTVPTTVVWGMDDRALLPSLLDGLSSLIPSLQIIRIEGASHWLIHEQPETVAGHVRRFLA